MATLAPPVPFMAPELTQELPSPGISVDSESIRSSVSLQEPTTPSGGGGGDGDGDVSEAAANRILLEHCRRVMRRGELDPERLRYFWRVAVKTAQAQSGNGDAPTVVSIPAECLDGAASPGGSPCDADTATDAEIPLGVAVGHAGAASPVAIIVDDTGVPVYVLQAPADGDATPVVVPVINPEDGSLPMGRWKRFRRRSKSWLRKYGPDILKGAAVIGGIAIMAGFAVMCPFGALIIIGAAGIAILGAEMAMAKR